MARDHDDDRQPGAALDAWPLDDVDAALPSRGAGAARLPGTEFELAVGSDAELELDLPPPPVEEAAPPAAAPVLLELSPPTPGPRREHSARRPLPRPRARRATWPLLAGALVVVAVATASLIALLGRGSPPPTAVPAAPTTVEPAAPAVDDLLFAGRDLGWWQQRLQSLAASPQGDELYRLTEQRARALGLLVERAASSVRVEVSPALLRSLAREQRP